jgi:leucyl aminopeptidase
MKVSVSQQDWTTIKSDAVIALLPEDQELTKGRIGVLDQKLGGLLTQMRTSGEFKGERGDTVVLFRPRGLDVERLVLAGNGPRADSDFGAIRASVHGAISKLKGFELDRLMILAPSWQNPGRSVQAVSEGIVLSDFTPAEYKTEDRSEIKIGEVVIAVSGDSDEADLAACVERGSILSQATNQARWLTNEPGNRVNPTSFSDHAAKLAHECHLEIMILEEAEMEQRGMNAVLAVARGSFHPAKFIVLNHRGSANPEEQPIALVGKGVTFDSGGISLKPAKSMEEMKADKAGACSVLGAMQAISKLKVATNVAAVLPVVENLPGGKAQRPGDVVKSLSGKTIEVVNTDAEGRLILADALSYARLEFNPCCVVDIATLTGACVVALGHVRAGLFSNNEDFCADVLKAADQCGERLWRLPLDREYRKDIESQIADMKNVGNRWGGAIVAAKFLEEFVGDTPWCHIDMAGVDVFHEKQSVEGPTGFGVRTLVELALNRSGLNVTHF